MTAPRTHCSSVPAKGKHLPRVMLTSFEPFEGYTLNSSLEVGRAVLREPPAGVRLELLVLPVVAGQCVEKAWRAIRRYQPGLVLALGQSRRAREVRVEVRARNRDHFRIPDNAGNQHRDQPIVPLGPALQRATIPTESIVAELTKAAIPACQSYSAGSYVCNHLFYQLLHRAAAERDQPRIGFIHLPLLPGQSRRRRMHNELSVDQMAAAIRLMIATCVNAAKGVESGRQVGVSKSRKSPVPAGSRG